MDKAVSTMMDNLKAKTGYTLDEWKKIVSKQDLPTHGKIVAHLKEKYAVTHGYASEIALKILASDADSAADTMNLLATQYQGKQHLKPIYELLVAEIEKFNGDFEVAPKKSYVSLKRKKQFVTLSPTSKTRFDIGFNLRGVPAQGILEAEKPNGICSHKISINSISDVNKEVLGWIKMAFEKAY